LPSVKLDAIEYNIQILTEKQFSGKCGSYLEKISRATHKDEYTHLKREYEHFVRTYQKKHPKCFYKSPKQWKSPEKKYLDKICFPRNAIKKGIYLPHKPTVITEQHPHYEIVEQFVDSAHPGNSTH
jgi:hypothetical protein